MANIKISELPLQGNRPEGNDVFPIVDVSTSPNNPVTKKITLSGASQEIVSIGWDVYTGNLYSTGNSININSNLVVTGNSIFNNNVVITGNTNIQNSLSTSGLTTINNNLIVTGNTNISGNTNIVGSTTLRNTTINGDLVVTGNTNLTGPLTNTNVTNLQNGLNVTGSTTFSSPVTINSNSTVAGDLVVNGSFSYSGLTVTGDTTLTSLQVTNGITGNSISAVTITATSISANVRPFYTNRGSITVNPNTQTVVTVTIPANTLQLGSTIETYTLFTAATSSTTISVCLSTGNTFNIDPTGFLTWGPQSGSTTFQYPTQIKVKDNTTLVSWPVIRTAVNQNSTTAIRSKTVPDISTNDITLNWSFSASSIVTIENLFFEINY